MITRSGLPGEEGPRFRDSVRGFAGTWVVFCLLIGIVFGLLGGIDEGGVVFVASVIVGVALYPVLWVRWTWVPPHGMPLSQRLKVIGLAGVWAFGVLAVIVALGLALA